MQYRSTRQLGRSNYMRIFLLTPKEKLSIRKSPEERGLPKLLRQYQSQQHQWLVAPTCCSSSRTHLSWREYNMHTVLQESWPKQAMKHLQWIPLKQTRVLIDPRVPKKQAKDLHIVVIDLLLYERRGQQTLWGIQNKVHVLGRESLVWLFRRDAKRV